MADFGTTPRETIGEAYRTSQQGWNRLDLHTLAMKLVGSESDLLNLLDVLTGTWPLNKRIRADREQWARDTRIGILASLGLEEKP